MTILSAEVGNIIRKTSAPDSQVAPASKQLKLQVTAKSDRPHRGAALDRAPQSHPISSLPPLPVPPGSGCLHLLHSVEAPTAAAASNKLPLWGKGAERFLFWKNLSTRSAGQLQRRGGGRVGQGGRERGIYPSRSLR